MRKKIILIISVIVLAVILSMAGFLIYKNYIIGKPCSNCQTKTEKKVITTEKRIIMFGRSVMDGWFKHWHSDNTPEKKEGYSLEYYELESPPEIVQSFKKQIDNISLQDKPIIFFKLCFVDFEGSSPGEAIDNLEQNKNYVREVYEIAKQKKLKLIIGNALPQVAANTTPDLLWNHGEFNKWLLDFQSKHKDDVIIFDMHSILSDSLGNLKSEFTDDQSDSHLNDFGYSALDNVFFTMLKK